MSKRKATKQQADVMLSFAVVVNPSGSMMRAVYLPLVVR